MPNLVVSFHAIKRYRERVEDVSNCEAIARLSGPAFLAALDFGAPFVKLAGGQRALNRDDTVVTVIPPEQNPQKMWAFFDRGGHDA